MQLLTVFRSMSEKGKRMFLLYNIAFFKLFLWANRTEVWHSCRFFCRESRSFFALNPNFFKKTLLCSKYFFLSKQSSALQESHFDGPSIKIFAKNRKLTKRFIEHRELWSKTFPFTFNRHFRERSQIFFGNFPAFIAQNLKKTKEFLFWTTLFSSRFSLG